MQVGVCSCTQRSNCLFLLGNSNSSSNTLKNYSIHEHCLRSRNFTIKIRDKKKANRIVRILSNYAIYKNAMILKLLIMLEVLITINKLVYFL